VRCRTNGRRRLARLRGLCIFWDGRSDRPPPSVATSKERFREWLYNLGAGMKPGQRSGMDTGRQVSLTTSVMAE